MRQIFRDFYNNQVSRSSNRTKDKSQTSKNIKYFSIQITLQTMWSYSYTHAEPRSQYNMCSGLRVLNYEWVGKLVMIVIVVILLPLSVRSVACKFGIYTEKRATEATGHNYHVRITSS